MCSQVNREMSHMTEQVVKKVRAAMISDDQA